MKTIKKLLYLLLPYERKRLMLLLGMMIVMAILEMLGVVSIMPFMAVLANSEIIETNIYLNTAYLYSNKLGVETKEHFLFLLGIIVFLLLIFSLAFKFLTIYAQLRFIAGRDYSLAKRFVEGYLHQPYSWFLNRHSADLGKNILSEVNLIITQGFNPMLDLLRQSAVTLALVVILILVNPILTLIVGLTLGITYGLIYIFIRAFAGRLGQKRLDANKWIFTSISEAFGAIKEIKMSGVEQAYVKKDFQTLLKLLQKLKRQLE